MKAFFYGVTRFSLYLPGSRAWLISGKSVEQYYEELYSEERMLPRLKIFLDYALPIYEKYADNYNYRHILMCSKVMPQKYWDILLREASKYKFLTIYTVEGEIDLKAPMKASLPSGCDDSIVATIRIDDDDLLSEDYLDFLSEYTKEPFVGMSVSFGKGYLAKYDEKGFSSFRYIDKRFLALGQASIGKYTKSDGKIYIPKSASHAKTDHYRPVIVDSRSPLFLLTYHANQGQRTLLDKASVEESVDSQLQKYTKVSGDSNIIDKFPTLSKDAAETLKGAESKFLGEVEFKGDHGAAVSLNLVGGREYRIYVSVPPLDVGVEPRAMVVCVGGNIDKEVLGMNYSRNTNIGWFVYIKVSSSGSEKVVDIKPRHDIGAIKILPWKWGGDVDINLAVEEI